MREAKNAEGRNGASVGEAFDAGLCAFVLVVVVGFKLGVGLLEFEVDEVDEWRGEGDEEGEGAEGDRNLSGRGLVGCEMIEDEGDAEVDADEMMRDVKYRLSGTSTSDAR